MTLERYIDNINAKYQLGNATEHTFRGLLEQLLESIVPEIRATNEPKRQLCGAPDYILTKKEIPVGFIEAKDIGDKDLLGIKKTGNKEQFDRYKNSLNNLIFTDYIDFHLYNDGIFVTKIAIAELKFPTSGDQVNHLSPEGRGGNSGFVSPLPENFATFTNLIKDFCSTVSQTIKSPKKLAEMMAGKARLLSDVIEQALTSDQDNSNDSTLKDQMTAFKEILIHDITPKGFADVYAQTIAYGMFAARLHDPTLPTFSRQEASELIPKSNPFLRKLFGYIAGPDLDDRIKWIVDSLVEIFLACNVEDILKNYSPHRTSPKGGGQGEDPIIHFYETFLSEYDPKLRKARGVWYTPKPVVNFIIRAVDDILKTEFDLPQGLADNSKIKLKFPSSNGVPAGRGGQEVHKVQILDPATGTGTFLAEVVKHIHAKFKGQQGVWSNYVETHLLPRLNGFELLMASYAMAHLQMDLLLTETGYRPLAPKGGTAAQRLRIYLTNSLEESHPDTGTLFANWLSSEANEANFIKRDTPVMCIVGNPPYSGESKNKGEWIMQLMEDYKKEPGGKEKLKERNPKWINDDYVKFLRYGQYYIEKNGSGVLAYINPHGFLDNPTFRGMRWNLLKTYDKIYTIDLHGNAKKKETSPDGSADVNVFDIEQGVSINVFVKTGKKKPNELGKVFHYDLYGKRDFKYDLLEQNSLKKIDFKELPNVAPNYFFVNKNFDQQKKYDEGFAVNILFTLNNVGIVTAKDSILINENKIQLLKNVENYYNINADINKIMTLSYRPFDDRLIYFDVKLVERAREKIMNHFIHTENIGLVVKRQCKQDFTYSFVTNQLTEGCLFESAYANNSILPLYLYPESNGQLTTDATTPPDGHPSKGEFRVPNLNLDIVNEIANNLDLKFTNEKTTTVNSPLEGCLQGGVEFSPIDILDYIYAVLHSPNYREKYKEFLKIDFPKIPYPKNTKTFWELVALGSQIREIHLLESPKVENYITEFNIDGNCVVEKPRFLNSPPFEGCPEGGVVDAPSEEKIPPHPVGTPQEENFGKVYINETQCFENVPEVAWNFYIGGYQPAQKWLKDRKGRKLEFDDIAHYQKIIVALFETDKLMKKINKIEIENL